jgi:hypothetical protein
MLAYKIQTPGNYPEESIQHSEQGETLKSRIISTSILQLRLHTGHVKEKAVEAGMALGMSSIANHITNDVDTISILP